MIGIESSLGIQLRSGGIYSGTVAFWRFIPVLKLLNVVFLLLPNRETTLPLSAKVIAIELKYVLQVAHKHLKVSSVLRGHFGVITIIKVRQLLKARVVE